MREVVSGVIRIRLVEALPKDLGLVSFVHLKSL